MEPNHVPTCRPRRGSVPHVPNTDTRIASIQNITQSKFFYDFYVKIVLKTCFFRDLVMHLIEKWKFDHGTLLQNETPSDYSVYTPAPPRDTYGPPPNTIYPYPAPVYGPPANTHDPYANRSPNSYIPPPPIHHPLQNQSYPYPPASNYPQPKFPYNSNVYHDVQQNHYKNMHFQPEFNRFQQNVWNKW